jgi:propanol-preferring alcohol dehydrogenase
VPVDVIVFRELSIVGSFGMQAARYPEMLDLVESKKVNPQLLLGETVALEQAGDVLAAMSSYETLAMRVITKF